MKRIAIIIALLALAGTSLRAQEYRIRQQLPDNINSIVVECGWDVRIVQQHDQPNCVSIITPCEAYYTEGNEPEVCHCDKEQLDLLGNTSMPRSTIIEISLHNPIKSLTAKDSSHLITGNLLFDNSADIALYEHASVLAGTWATLNPDNSADATTLDLMQNASLTIDTLSLANCNMRLFKNSTLNCRHIAANQHLDVRRHRLSQISPMPSVTASDLYYHQGRRLSGFTNYMLSDNQLTLNTGLDFYFPAYLSHQYNSPYNIGYSFGIPILIGLSDIEISKRITLSHKLMYQWRWTQLLSDVESSGTALNFSTAYQGQTVKQNLFTQSIGLPLRLNCELGSTHSNSYKNSFRGFVGLTPSCNVKSTLVTSLLGSDNRFVRSRDEADIMSPFQLRAEVGISQAGGFLGRASATLFADLLPTYRKGLGVDNFHQMGIAIRF